MAERHTIPLLLPRRSACCAWDAGDRVVSLHLPTRGLAGPLPPPRPDGPEHDAAGSPAAAGSPSPAAARSPIPRCRCPIPRLQAAAPLILPPPAPAASQAAPTRAAAGGRGGGGAGVAGEARPPTQRPAAVGGADLWGEAVRLCGCRWKGSRMGSAEGRPAPDAKEGQGSPAPSAAEGEGPLAPDAEEGEGPLVPDAEEGERKPATDAEEGEGPTTAGWRSRRRRQGWP
uniref:Uncharacterized protein n=1 Tax=Setaria italica TaxID=4555 RepID=K4AEP8_SETIT